MVDVYGVVPIIEADGVRIVAVTVTRMKALLIGEGADARVTEPTASAEPEIVEVVTMTMSRLGDLLRRRSTVGISDLLAELRELSE